MAAAASPTTPDISLVHQHGTEMCVAIAKAGAAHTDSARSVARWTMEYADVAGADHYYIERPELLPVAVELCSDWIARKFG